MNERLNSRKAAYIGYILGQSAMRSEYPVSSFISVTVYKKEDVCRVARMLGLRVTKHKGEWYEGERLIDDIIATMKKKD